jgi:hypothetical protein
MPLTHAKSSGVSHSAQCATLRRWFYKAARRGVRRINLPAFGDMRVDRRRQYLCDFPK